MQGCEDACRFLRSTNRKKFGKEHRYYSVVEKRRVRDGRSLQKTLLYLGEINDGQKAGWIHAIEVVEGNERRQLARTHAPGLTPRSILEQMKSIQMIDVHIPTTDGRELKMFRHTKPAEISAGNLRSVVKTF